MNISYCITCHNRLWQLKQTIEHNLKYTKPDEIELCILFYNDLDSLNYVYKNYSEYIDTKQLRLLSVFEDKVFEDGSRWSCGYVKDLVHKQAKGKVLFNLDADNFIDDVLQKHLLTLQPHQVIITKQSEWKADGRSGRIGMHHLMYKKVKYLDKGRDDDGDILRQVLHQQAKFIELPCLYTPINNDR